jgi:hypothetical protein
MKAPDKIRNRVFNDHLSIPFYRGCNSEEPLKINREAFAIGFQNDGRDGDDGQGVINGFDVTCPQEPLTSNSPVNRYRKSNFSLWQL